MWVFKHLTLQSHSQALAAATAAECAGDQEAFWGMHDLLFENNRALEDDDIAGYVRQAGGIDFAEWQRCYDAKQPKAQVEEDQRIAVAYGALFVFALAAAPIRARPFIYFQF